MPDISQVPPAPGTDSLPVSNTSSTPPPQNGTFVTTNDPTLTRRYHPKSTVYIRGHRGDCTFCGFEQMCNTCIYHYGITQRKPRPRNPLFSACSSLSPPPAPGNHLAFYYLPQSLHFQKVIRLESYSRQPFHKGSFHLVIRI